MILSPKRLCKRLLNQLGYEVRPVSQCIDSVAALSVKESQHYTRWSTSCPVFTPWMDHPDFQQFYEGVKPHTLVSPDRCYILFSFASYAVNVNGDFAECGVYKGGTALLLCRASRGTSKTLYLFDSFEGLPRENEAYDNHYKKGMFADACLEDVKKVLDEFANLIDIRVGWIPNSFVGLDLNRYAFVHVDVDLYQSALDCCSYFYPRVVPGGVLLFDEYGFPATRGEKDAVDQFFSDKPENPISLPTGQAFVIKVSPCVM